MNALRAQEFLLSISLLQPHSYRVGINTPLLSDKLPSVFPAIKPLSAVTMSFIIHAGPLGVKVEGTGTQFQ